MLRSIFKGIQIDGPGEESMQDIKERKPYKFYQHTNAKMQWSSS